MDERLSPEDSKTLIDLCRKGRLYEVETWIASGKTLRISAALKQSPLQVAISTGFHSLVELLAKHEESQETKDLGLAAAVAGRRLDFIELLVNHGASVASVPFVDVLLNWNPRIIRFFIDRGADPISGSPFAVAFGSKVRTALRPFVELKRSRPDLAAAMQEQIDCALRHFCYEGDLKWINLLLWAGGDARSLGPTLDKDYTNDPECFSSGIHEVCYRGHLAALKRLKPDPNRDNLNELLDNAAISANKEMLQYLLQLGANPNDKSNGGSNALDRCLWGLNFGAFNAFDRHRPRSKYDVHRALESISELVQHGAKWIPTDQYHINALRKCLYECEPAVTVELLQVFTKYGAAEPEKIKDLLRPPRMKQHLESQSWHLTRLGLNAEERKQQKERSNAAAARCQYDRAALYEKVWSEPTRNVAKSYGVSDVWLGKVCKWLEVPVPGRGYWAKKAAGKQTKNRPPLKPLRNTRINGDQRHPVECAGNVRS